MYYRVNVSRKPAVASHAYTNEAILSPDLIGRLGDCVRAYEKQAARPAGSRSRVALFVSGASRAEGRAIATFFADRLALPIARVDAKAIEGTAEDAALAAIRPLVSRGARIALVEGLRNGADARLCDGLAWSSRDVLVVACGALGETTLDARFVNTFDFAVDCRVKTRVTMAFLAALRV